MKYQTLLFLALFIFLSCNQSESLNTINKSNTFCSEYNLDTPMFLGNDGLPVVKVKLIILKKNNKISFPINIGNLEEKLNREFSFTSFKVVEKVETVVKEFENKILDYYELLKFHNSIDHLDIIVIPNSVHLLGEENGIEVGGAALGIPEVNNFKKGRTCLFVRRKNLVNNILIHEVGHVFGLYHTFREGPNHSCVFGDKVYDTVGAEEGSNVVWEGCKYRKNNSILDRVEQEHAVRNIMSYSPPHCLTEITTGQIERMKKIFETSPYIEAILKQKDNYQIFKTPEL